MANKLTFFERLLNALDRDTLERMAREECGIESPGQMDKKNLIATMIGRDNACLRASLIDYVKNVI